jgi:hypothetical protein
VSPYEELRVLLAIIPEGGQGEKQICPFCGGGRSGEKSLDIVRFEGYSGAYQCKRAQCGKEGYIGDRFGTHYQPSITQRPKEWEPRIYDGTIEELPDDIIDQWPAKYGWSEADIRATGCGWSPEYRRTAWKIHSPTGVVRGIELRTFDPKSRAKTLHFRHSADPWVGYITEGSGWRGVSGERNPNGAGGAPLIAVEDLMSAYRVGQVYPAASIMGSHLTFETLMDLMKVSEKVVLCLDRDATTKAEKFAARFRFLCPDFVHVPLQRDLKYEHPDRIKEIIGEVL